MEETLGKRAFPSTLERVAGGHSGGFAAKRNAFGPQRMTNEAFQPDPSTIEAVGEEI